MKTKMTLSKVEYLFFVFTSVLQIISQRGNGNELLCVNFSLFNYPDDYQKSLDTLDCDVKIQFAKANIVFLFKHIDTLLVSNLKNIEQFLFLIYCFRFFKGFS